MKSYKEALNTASEALTPIALATVVTGSSWGGLCSTWSAMSAASSSAAALDLGVNVANAVQPACDVSDEVSVRCCLTKADIANVGVSLS